MIFCGLNGFTKPDLCHIHNQEIQDGRFINVPRNMKDPGEARLDTLLPKSYNEQIMAIDQQVHIAFGFFILAVAGLGIHATPIGGFRHGSVDRAFDLRAKGVHSVLLAALGFSGEGDYNRDLPKSRLAVDEIIEFV